jgi:hypothetical protein
VDRIRQALDLARQERHPRLPTPNRPSARSRINPRRELREKMARPELRQFASV